MLWMRSFTSIWCSVMPCLDACADGPRVVVVPALSAGGPRPRLIRQDLMKEEQMSVATKCRSLSAASQSFAMAAMEGEHACRLCSQELAGWKGTSAPSREASMRAARQEAQKEACRPEAVPLEWLPTRSARATLRASGDELEQPTWNRGQTGLCPAERASACYPSTSNGRPGPWLTWKRGHQHWLRRGRGRRSQWARPPCSQGMVKRPRSSR